MLRRMSLTFHSLCVLPFSNSVRYETTTTFELASYALKMASFEEHLDRATRQTCLVLSGNDCKDLQRIRLQHLLSNWDVLGPIGGIAVDEIHTLMHW